MASSSAAMALSVLDQVVDVSAWKPYDDFPVYPKGAKPKRALVCPDEPPHPLLIAKHVYLFKRAEGWKAHQIWSEALAYQVGCTVSLDVPRCFLAHNPSTGETGALVEFFLGYPDEPSPRRLLHGADLLQEKGFTKGADRPHNLITNIGLCEGRGLPEPVEWWAKTVCFDALIGNTDRHTENWGLLADAAGGEQFAPRFDNGTSLAFQWRDDHIEDLMSESALDRFIDRGLGHMGWDGASDEPTPLVELCRHVVTLEKAGEAIRNVIHADLSGLRGAVEACGQLPLVPGFTPRRGDLVLAMIERRQTRLREVCGG